MAKQLISPFERHVEKGVLAIAGIVLIYVIAVYLVATPNRIELAGEKVTPGEIDRKVADEAEAVRRSVSSKTATVDDFSPLLGDFTRSIDPFKDGKADKHNKTDKPELVTQLSAAVAIAPEVPTIDPPGLTRGKTELVEVIKLGKPMTTSGRTTFNIDGEEIPTNWVTVSSVFNRKAQEELQLRTYGSKWIEVTFGPAELQRRLRHADGSWSEDDWEDIEAWPTGDTGEPPRFSLKDEDGEITIRNEDSNRAKKYEEAIGHRSLQITYIRPLPPPEINGTPWTFPIVTTKRDVAKQDEEYISDEAPVPNPPLDPDRYPNMVSGAETVVAVVKTLSPIEQVKQWFKDADQLLIEAERVQDPELAVQAYNLYSDIQLFDRATSADKKKAKKLQADAEAKEKDIRFNILNAKKRGSGGESGSAGGSVPGKIVRTFTDKQQLWAHDASPDSLEDGKTYQYRIRPVIFNPLFGVPGKFEDPADALVAFIKGEWSEPSDPVTIAPSVTYFVKRGDERKNVANIEVYQWFHGVWVSNGKLKLGVGQSVAGEGRANIPDPFTEGEVFRAPISFDARTTIVDIDFDRTLPTYDIKRGGVHIGAPKKTTGVVFLDARGELHERFEILDKRHPNRKKARDRVFRAPKGTR